MQRFQGLRWNYDPANLNAARYSRSWVQYFSPKALELHSSQLVSGWILENFHTLIKSTTYLSSSLAGELLDSSWSFCFEKCRSLCLGLVASGNADSRVYWANCSQTCSWYPHSRILHWGKAAYMVEWSCSVWYTRERRWSRGIKPCPQSTSRL